MDLVGMLRAEQNAVLGDAVEALGRAHLVHYESAGPEEVRRRLEHLYLLVLDSLSRRSLDPVCGYAEEVARERFEAGFDIAEVQRAFNVLEEAIWHLVVPRVDGPELAEATGLIGTVLGAGKDTLARTWVSLASKRHVSSLNLTALFEGSRG